MPLQRFAHGCRRSGGLELCVALCLLRLFATYALVVAAAAASSSLAVDLLLYYKFYNTYNVAGCGGYNVAGCGDNGVPTALFQGPD